MPEKTPQPPCIAESPISDVFEGRHPAASEKEWTEKTLVPTLDRAPEKPIGAPTGTNLDEHGHARFTTISDAPIRRLYTQADLPADWNYEQYLGYPGQPPYTRGIHADRLPRQALDHAPVLRLRFAGRNQPALQISARTRRRRALRRLRSAHADGLRLRPPGQRRRSRQVRRGHRFARRHGDSLRRHRSGKNHHLDDHQFARLGLWAMYLVVAEKQGADWKKISGTIQNDILKEYIAQKEYIYPPAPSMRLVIDTFEFGSKFTPRFNTISISGYHIREAGSTALQELAFTLYDGVEYVEWARRRGLDVDEFGPRLSFFFNAHNDFFEEIAKYRAARKIWYRLMKDRFGAKNERTRLMRFHTQTAGVSLPAQQPMNNIARVALQALAAVLGGTQSLHTDAYDEALALAHRRSRAHRIAHAADHRLRIGRGADRRSARRSLFRREANARHGKRRLRLLRQARRNGRHGQGHRARISAERNCRGQLPVPARR